MQRATTPVAKVSAAAAAVVLAGLLSVSPAAAIGDPVDPGSTEQESTTTTKPKAPSTSENTGPGGVTSQQGSSTDKVAKDGSSDDDDNGRSIVALGLVGLGGLVLGLLIAGLPMAAALSRRKQSSPILPAAGPPPGPAVPPAPGAAAPPGTGPVIGPAPSRDEDRLRSDRVRLIEALIALRDQLPSAALGDEAARGLAQAGVIEIRPDGQAFDATQHRAVHQVPTDDPARHNTVVSTERPGYADGNRVIRLPDVVVARQEGQP